MLPVWVDPEARISHEFVCTTAPFMRSAQEIRYWYVTLFGVRYQVVGMSANERASGVEIRVLGSRGVRREEAM